MFSIPVLAVVVTVMAMCSYIFVEQYNYLITDSTCAGKGHLLGCSSEQRQWSYSWVPFPNVFQKNAVSTVPERKYSSPRMLASYLLIGGSTYLIATALMAYYKPSTFTVKKALKDLYFKLCSITTVKEDFKIGLEGVYEELFKVFKSDAEKTPVLPESAEDLVETFRKLVIDAMDELQQQHQQQVLELKTNLEHAKTKQNQQEAAQKMYESEVQKDFKFMLAVKDSTIFALRISVKEHGQEIERLKNTIKLQHRSFQQSAELVTALKDGLLLQHKMKDQLAIELSAISTSSFTTSLKCLENYYSQYDKGRQNNMHWTDLEELHNMYMAQGDLGISLPPIPKMGLLSLPWSEDERLDSSNNMLAEFDRVSTA